MNAVALLPAETLTSINERKRHTWYFAGVTTEPTSCDHCGQAIKNRYHLYNGLGGTMIVGSDCFQHFLNDGESDKATQAVKRMNRAASQWRKQTPKSRDGETREQYISRRVAEMGNAQKAHTAWCGKWGQGSFYWTVDKQVKAQLPYFPQGMEAWTFRHWKGDGIKQAWNVNGLHEGTSTHDCWLCQQQAAVKKAYGEWQHTLHQAIAETITSEFETQYNANRYDFNRPVWEVRKI